MTITEPIPDEAVEAAARALDAAEYDDPDSVTEAEWAAVVGAEREFYLSAARRALTAAAPLIAAQATANLRAGIEALAGEMRADIARYLSTRGARITGETLAHYAAALDALLGGA